MGRGLAGVQVGVLRRLVVIDVAWKDGAPESLRFVDPEIPWRSDEQALREERCLSIPDAPTPVLRSTAVRVGYRGATGTHRERSFEGSLALVVQHEVDHLDGVLILDRAA